MFCGITVHSALQNLKINCAIGTLKLKRLAWKIEEM
jgi:hypothetical protein